MNDRIANQLRRPLGGPAAEAAARRTEEPTWWAGDGPPPRSVAFVHAHPDDETLSTGALIALLVEHGVDVTVVTATRGERGFSVLPGLVDDVPLAEVRAGEVAAACRALGVQRHVFLGTPPARQPSRPARRYVDSGLIRRGGQALPAAHDDPDAFTSCPLEEPVADLHEVLETVRPDLVVSYTSTGGYGHPDHIRASRVAAAAAGELVIPFAELVTREVHAHVGGVVDDSTRVWWFNAADQLPKVAVALGCHRTQAVVHGDRVSMSDQLDEPILTRFGLRPVPWEAA